MNQAIIKGEFKMRKYMIIAKNDYNEEIFYTDIKAEAKKKLDYCFDKYLFVKAYCYSYKDEMYKDITDLNEQSVYEVKVTERGYYSTIAGIKTEDNTTSYKFTNEADALRFIINSKKSGTICKLYKNGRRDWRV